MYCNRRCTFFRFDTAEDAYLKKVILCYVFNTYAGKNDKGIETGDKAIMRIPLSATEILHPDTVLKSKVGDRVFIGVTDEEMPPDEAYKIVLKRYNLRGNNPHIRIEAIR